MIVEPCGTWQVESTGWPNGAAGLGRGTDYLLPLRVPHTIARRKGMAGMNIRGDPGERLERTVTGPTISKKKWMGVPFVEARDCEMCMEYGGRRFVGDIWKRCLEERKVRGPWPTEEDADGGE